MSGVCVRDCVQVNFHKCRNCSQVECRYFYMDMDIPCPKKSAVVVRKSARMERGVESLHMEISFKLPYVISIAIAIYLCCKIFLLHYNTSSICKRFGCENLVLKILKAQFFRKIQSLLINFNKIPWRQKKKNAQLFLPFHSPD